TCNECKHHVETRWHCTVCEFLNAAVFISFCEH
ncbi:CREBBP isoform 22, partial [Pan troglodytes]